MIRAYDDGPLLVRGDFEIQTGDGEVIDAKRATVALCRCGKSAIKPFCDGRHVAARFQASTARSGRGAPIPESAIQLPPAVGGDTDVDARVGDAPTDGPQSQGQPRADRSFEQPGRRPQG